MQIETLLDFRDIEKCPRLVIKLGSALLVDKEGMLRRDWLRTVAMEIAGARQRGQEIIVVCSGSVALGAAMLDLPAGGRETLAHAQASASVGQVVLAATWAQLLREHDVLAGQMLLTLDDLEGRRRYLNAAATIRQLLQSGVVPIINENDSIATSEIRFGDNDRLAARVAQAASAQGVLLLSDVDGLYDRHPDDPDAERVEAIRGVTDEIHDMATGGSSSGMGSGGMTSKLLAAEIAERAGIALAIVNGTPDIPIGRALAANTGTLFLPKRDDSAFKSWIGGRLRFNGSLTVDDGCIEALKNGKSLLAAGIIEVTGDFERGDVIAIKDKEGRMVAKGMSEYDYDEADAIKGLRSDQVADRLGHLPRSAVIHRDQLVIL
ncbi:glutamate 5-kinase [Altererythrobacter xiamenensis]|uniref:Glutamate 5-kinase n=1 Tax=Altererythrobacter xiamenensis TaxID=1316679 RepID=A0A1Y6EG50_9SPHN|nr:glutamate 5-kinase [Altererythrobacter xiamenensis]SMQ61577.1 glutamate 5-kinase [Altererythrobacter xiamenensis]